MTNPTKEMRACPCKDKPANPTCGKCTTLHSARVDLFAAHVLTGLFAASGREAFNVHPETAGYYAAEIACAVVRAIDEEIKRLAGRVS